ncbi:ethanolamine ammonia-lyase subunit EutC [Aestuariicella hydrocarbonica]|uniref:Ethanolamine ammonia-lyase small subunit n=1 Tax=Pseudomaricurvus hydrocarbonicus TaxID=1470433 RepID=A0A9E5JVV9_9GAMM|nr:ethanolamine ammonia-lyase subunit EutC [Aestuariicella hydrocarbonica]NHO65845.1 ethanolamine ammonia-lyase subunit EutC [Aestuariicella hydrocarbonica]
MATDMTSDPMHGAVTDNAWQPLRSFTAARIGLGRAGTSLPTQRLQEFQLAHARAQDAVHQPLDVESLTQKLAQLPWPSQPTPLRLHSDAPDRGTYLQRPDLGRRLHTTSQQRLSQYLATGAAPIDLTIVLADGLSALAIEKNALPFLQQLLPALQQSASPWQLAPLCIVEQGRVAIGDHVGESLAAHCVLVLIGERPGLSSPDSMGLYLTWQPQRGLTDATRNCISNIRSAGLTPQEASRKALYLLTEARRRQLSGVQLKERSDQDNLEYASGDNNFLIPSG